MTRMTETVRVSTDSPGMHGRFSHGCAVTAEGAEGFVAAREDEQLVRAALELAREGGVDGEVPVGALVVAPDGRLIGRGHNRRALDADPSAHAEVVALRQAATELGTWRLAGCTLVASLEPCVMCAGVLMAARIERVVFGAWDLKAGACGSVWDLPRDPRSLHRVETVGGVLAEECAAELQTFFAQRRGVSADEGEDEVGGAQPDFAPRPPVV